MRGHSSRIFAASLSLATLAGAGAAQVTTGLPPSDIEGGDRYGFAVAVSGSAGVVGAPLDEDGGVRGGSAYFLAFDGAGWSVAQKVTPLARTADASLGFSVSMNGALAAVGAPHLDDPSRDLVSAGGVFVFENTGTTWAEGPLVRAEDRSPYDRFGWSVSLSATRILAGAPSDDLGEGAENSGAAYVFVRTPSGWVEEAKLVAADAAKNDWFGKSVALWQDFAAIGVAGDDDVGADSGSVYVFHRSGATWTEVAKLTASNGQPYDQLGFSVALDGERLVAGAPGIGDKGTGGAYVFELGATPSTWVETAQLGPATLGDWEKLGSSVAVRGDVVVVGANGRQTAGTNSGSVYVYREVSGSLSLVATVSAHDASATANFGRAVGVSAGGTVLAGAPRADAACPGDPRCNSGAAYVFDAP